jgi:hypothetical protein
MAKDCHHYIYVAINPTDASGFNNADIAASSGQPMTS